MNPDELIAAHLDGTLDETGSTQLNSWLKASPENMKQFTLAMMFDQQVRQSVQAQAAESAVQTLMQSAASLKAPRLLQWHPMWAAAAAGLVIGLFSASLVWAYAVPSHTSHRIVSLVSEDFEQAEATPHRGFPRVANEWAGDMTLATEADSSVKPLNGKHMVRLNRKSTRMLAYAWRVVDLADYPLIKTAESRRLEVSASFATHSVPRPLRYQIRLAALSQEPAVVRKIWNDEPTLFDTVLQHVGRNVEVKAGDNGWHSVLANLEIPPGTRSVVISLAAGETSPDEPVADHYLDDVQAHFVITPVLAPVE